MTLNQQRILISAVSPFHPPFTTTAWTCCCTHRLQALYQHHTPLQTSAVYHTAFLMLNTTALLCGRRCATAPTVYYAFPPFTPLLAPMFHLHSRPIVTDYPGVWSFSRTTGPFSIAVQPLHMAYASTPLRLYPHYYHSHTRAAIYLQHTPHTYAPTGSRRARTPHCAALCCCGVCLARGTTRTLHGTHTLYARILASLLLLPACTRAFTPRYLPPPLTGSVWLAAAAFPHARPSQQTRAAAMGSERPLPPHRTPVGRHLHLAPRTPSANEHSRRLARAFYWRRRWVRRIARRLYPTLRLWALVEGAVAALRAFSRGDFKRHQHVKVLCSFTAPYTFARGAGRCMDVDAPPARR